MDAQSKYTYVRNKYTDVRNKYTDVRNKYMFVRNKYTEYIQNSMSKTTGWLLFYFSPSSKTTG